VRRLSLLPAWLLSLAAWGVPPTLPDDAALRQEMARQQARGQEVMRRTEERFRVDPARPMQSVPRLPDTVAVPAAGPDPLAVAERFRRERSALAQANVGPDLLVFVSFSMPKASLERMAREAGRADAVLVFRGPKDGSLRKTVRAFEPLARLGAKAILHPEAFTRNRVEAVPVYVLGAAAGGCDETAGACGEALRLAGDVSLEDALERMARSRHPLGRQAEARLDRMREAR
jgi:type-F conjugative transfer system pilin assembly protein TrbC